MKSRRIAAFTLVEMMVALVASAIVGLIVYSLLSATLSLYAKNYGINETHLRGRSSTGKLFSRVVLAAGAPELIDQNGAPVLGNGPAAGIRCLLPASPVFYPLVSAASATSSSMTVSQPTGQPAPQAGDVVVMTDLGFQAEIQSVSPSGLNFSLTFASSVGSYFIPAKTSGTVIPSTSKALLLFPTAFICTGSDLRHYPRAMSVASHGAGAFNNAANFLAAAQVLPQTGFGAALPFSYSDPSRRFLDVDLRIRAPSYGSSAGSFNTFTNIKTTLAYRSAAILRKNF